MGKGKSFRSSLPSLTQIELLQQTTKAGIDTKQTKGVVTLSSNDGDFDVAGTLNEQDVKTSLIRDHWHVFQLSHLCQ